MTEEPTQYIHKTAEKLLAATDVEGEVSLKKVDEGDRPTVIVHIKTEDSRLLIGEHGANLAAFQHVLRTMINKKLDSHLSLVVDVNDYREKKEEALGELAKRAISKVKATESLVILKPMSAFERRIIHTVIAKETGLMTESLGEEPNRRVVVKIHKEKQSLDQVSDDIDL